MHSYHYHYFGGPSTFPLVMSPKLSTRKTSAHKLSSRKSLPKKRKSSSCKGIRDPYTQKCLKLSMHGTVYER